MGVGLVVFGGIEVDNAIDSVDVDAPSRYICRDKSLRLAVDEGFQCIVTLVLGSATVNNSGLDAVALELTGNAIRTVPCSAEHNGLTMRADLVGSERDLFGSIDPHEPMGHAGHVRLAFPNLVEYRIALVAVGQSLDLFAKRGREKDGLAIVVCEIENLLYDGEESHVGHTVGLIHDGDLDLAQANLVLIDQVEKASRTRDEHVDAISERLQLCTEADAPVHGCNAAVSHLRQRVEFSADLFGKLAGGGEDQTCRCMRLCVLEACDHRNSEGECLAGARGCSSENVTAGESVWDRRRLDFKRRENAIFFQHGNEVTRYAKIGKMRCWARLSRHVGFPVEGGEKQLATRTGAVGVRLT